MLEISVVTVNLNFMTLLTINLTFQTFQPKMYNDPQFLEGRQPENGKKKLNWTVFLALFAVFSSDERTLKMLDSMEVFQEGGAKEM